MRTLSPSELQGASFGATFKNALAQYWHTTRSFQCLGSPKKQHLLLFLDGCRIRYTDKAGGRHEAGPGDAVYTPAGSEYRAELSDFRDESAHTVGINFSLSDAEGEPASLSDGILILRGVSPHAALLFRSAQSPPETPLAGKILLLGILEALFCPRSPAVPAALRPAIAALSEEGGLARSIPELAERCHLSEPYFRRLFRHGMGVSPAAYRKHLRLRLACSYLEYGAISVGEISEMLGYSSVSHFIGEFKKEYGIPPLGYRKLTGGG